jgi:hypothetical protein
MADNLPDWAKEPVQELPDWAKDKGPALPESARQIAEAYGKAKPAQAVTPMTSAETGEQLAKAYAQAQPAQKPVEREPYTPGQLQYERDVAIAGEPSARAATEYALKRAADAALMNIPKHVRVWSQLPSGMTPEESAAIGEAGERMRRRGLSVSPTETERFRKLTENVPSVAPEYRRLLAEENERLAAQARQYPVVGPVAEVGGIVGSMFLPGGPIAKGAQAIEKGVSAIPAIGKFSRGISTGVSTGATSGIGGYLDEMDVNQGLKSAGIGAIAGPALRSGVESLIAKIKSKPQTNISQAVDEAFGDALKQGRLLPEDIRAIKTNLEEIAKQKGASAETMREGFLKAAGVEIPTRQQVTGQKVAPAIRTSDEINRVTQAAPSEIMDQLSGRVPLTPTQPNVIAESIYNLERRAYRAASKEYDELRAIKGTLFDSAIADVIPSVNASMKAAGVPSKQYLQTIADNMPNSNKAYDLLVNTFAMRQLPFARTEDMKSFDFIMRRLNDLRSSAKTTDDRNAVIAMIKGYKDSFENTMTNKLFSGDAVLAAQKMKSAPGMWSDYRSSFYGKSPNADAVFKRAIREFMDENGAISNTYVDKAGNAAQGILNSALLNPRLGASVYDKMQQVMGAGSPAMQAVRDHIRNAVFQPPAASTKNWHKSMADQMSGFLKENPLVAQRVFSPEERRNMRLAAEAIRIVSAKPTKEAEKVSEIGRIVNKYGLASMFGFAGWLSSHISGMPKPLSATVGAIAGTAGRMATAAGERASVRRQIEAELAGAPRAMAPPSDIRLAPPTSVPSGSDILPSEQDRKMQGYEPGRPVRASGGRINPSSKADGLVIAAEKAKKNINKTTEPLLNETDNNVAHALEIAGKHL